MGPIGPSPGRQDGYRSGPGATAHPLDTGQMAPGLAYAPRDQPSGGHPGTRPVATVGLDCLAAATHLGGSRTGSRRRVCLVERDGRLFFAGASDAAIVSGLVALLLRVYSGRTRDEIAAWISLDPQKRREIMNELVFMCKEVQIINTICRPVQNRQDDALDLAASVDLMIVVGSRTSANTMELAALCRYHNPHTIHIQNADELAYSDFDWAGAIGIASGLSTPEDIVQGVRTKIEEFEGEIHPERKPDPSSYAALAHSH